METGTSSTAENIGTGCSVEDVCPLCLEIFIQPKFLPCHHTFCQRCIEDLVRGAADRTFPCPSCRKTTTLPPGGAADLQTNFYIKTSRIPRAATPAQIPAPAAAARAQDVCKTHRHEKLICYCTECEEPICIKCKLTKHDIHFTDDLDSVVARVKKELRSDRRRLQKAESDIKTDVNSLEQTRTKLEKRRAEVENAIRKRHAAVVRASTQHMEEQLVLLRSTCTDLDKDVVGVIKQREVNKAKLSALLQEVDDATDSGTVTDVFTVAEELRNGRGSWQAVDDLTSRESEDFELEFEEWESKSSMMDTIRSYIGRVSRWR